MVAGTVVVAGACAPVSQAAVNGVTLKSQSSAQAYTRGTEGVIAFGFDAISDRYVSGVTAATLALEGIRGFASIDPILSADRIGAKLVFKAGEKILGEYPAPADNDVEGWAQVTMAAYADGRTASPDLAKAGDDRMVEAVFDAALAKLDPFSRYAGPKEAGDHRASRNGFGGIGIRFENKDGHSEISAVMPESPADRAKLKVGDTITHIDGQSIVGLDQQGISNRLRGAVATDVALTLQRSGAVDPLTVTLRRTLVVPPTVTMTIDDGIANIRITGFNQRTASSLAERLREAKDRTGNALKGVLVDLRGNPGGLLDQAVAMADLFMSQGRIVSTRGRHANASQTYDAAPGDLAEDLAVVLLVDGKSASASEILAAALQDAGRAVVIGTNSYGKGTVQTVIRMPNDGEMTLTWSRFHSPTGYALHGLGVLPIICTSDDHSDAAKLVRAVAEGGMNGVATTLAAWRHTRLDETDLRSRMRTSCPSQRHADFAVDLDIAKQLLADRALYAQALSIGLPSVLTQAQAVKRPL